MMAALSLDVVYKLTVQDQFVRNYLHLGMIPTRVQIRAEARRWARDRRHNGR